MRYSSNTSKYFSNILYSHFYIACLVNKITWQGSIAEICSIFWRLVFLNDFQKNIWDLSISICVLRCQNVQIYPTWRHSPCKYQQRVLWWPGHRRSVRKKLPTSWWTNDGSKSSSETLTTWSGWQKSYIINGRWNLEKNYGKSQWKCQPFCWHLLYCD